MAAKNRKQVWLQIRPCYSANNGWFHDGHLYHLRRQTTSSNENQIFHCYLYCPGLEDIELKKVNA